MNCSSTSYGEAVRRLEAIAETWAASTAADGPRYVKLSGAVGCISAEDVYSTRFLPPYDNSAMDGYAVTSTDTLAASSERPIRLRVIGSIAAGDPPPRYTHNETTRPNEEDVLSCYHINTGSPFPLPSSSSSCPDPAAQPAANRYDSCARIEIVKQISSDLIELTEPIKARQHRRQAGEDIQPGLLLLRKGQRIRPGDIACLASSGLQKLKVGRKPRVAVLTTGKELRNPEQDDNEIGGLGEGQIFNSNGPYIRAALRDWGYEDVALLGSVGDDPEDYKAKISTEIAGQYDVLVTTGGVSKGQHDYVRNSLISLDATILFHGVAIRPGHPVLAATLPSASQMPLVVFSLPGNPVAAAACLRFLVAPFMLKAAGEPAEKPFLRAVLVSNTKAGITEIKHKRIPSSHANGTGSGDVVQRTGPRCFLLAKYSLPRDSQSASMEVAILAKGSGMVRPLSQANCWVVLEEGQQEEGGKIVDCWSMSPR